MLVHSPPRSLFASDYSMGTSMDISPSHLRDSQQFFMPHELEMHGHHAAGFMHSMPFENQPPMQSSASMSFGPSYSGTQSYMSSTASMPQLSNPIRLESLPSTSRFAPNSRPSLPPLTIDNGLVKADMLAVGGHSRSGSSTSSFADHQQATGFSRRPEGTDGSSSKSSPTDAKQFGRSTLSSGRQRSVQACQKCRDRKTKCSGTKPSCKRCSDRGLTCNWAPDPRSRGSSRHFHRQRLDSVDSAGEPLSALPYPLSLPGSPRRHSASPVGPLEVVHSAPPTQLTFQHFTFPTAQPKKHERMWKSLPTDALRAIAVARGSNALSVMGEPIQPLNSVDDGWDSVGCAKLEIAVKHCQDAPGGPHALTGIHASGEPSHLELLNALNVALQSGESSNASSPPSFGQPISSGESSDNEPPRLSLPPHMQQHELHHPFPSYEPRSQLGGEMTKLLGLQGTHALDSIYELGPFEGQHAFIQAVHQNGVQVAEQDTTPMISPPSSDKLISQYFNPDAFESKPHV